MISRERGQATKIELCSLSRSRQRWPSEYGTKSSSTAASSMELMAVEPVPPGTEPIAERPIFVLETLELWREYHNFEVLSEYRLLRKDYLQGAKTLDPACCHPG